MNPPINLPDGGAGAAGTADAYAHLLQPVTADDALTLPNFVQLNIKNQPPGPDVAVSMMLNNPGDGLGRYAMASVTMIGTAPVTSTSIKKIAYRRATVHNLRRELYRINSSWLNNQPNKALLAYFQGKRVRKMSTDKARNPSEATLAQAVEVRDVARAVGDYCNMAVARAFGISRPMAVTWMRRAHRLGFD